MKNVMLDLETFGTKERSVLRSIGAIGFDLNGNMGAAFYENIDRQSCIEVGLKVDPATEKWWSQQAQEAQDALLVNPQPFKDVVKHFHDFFRTIGAEKVWCQGANFDAPLWESACAVVAVPVPWKFWNVRDTRTVYDIAGFNDKTMPRDGTHHNALDDAKHQVRCVASAVAKMRKEIAA